MHVKIIEPSHYLPNGTLCRYPKMSPETLRDGLWKAIRQFYRIPAIIHRMLKNLMGKPLVWGAIFALNYFYRRSVYNRDNRLPTIWHAPN